MWSAQHLKDLEGTDNPVTDDERIKRENNWVKGLNRGDGKAFEAMYRYYYPRLGKFLIRYVHSKKVAEDLIHNLFYSIWKNREKLEPKGTLRAYLYTAIQNQAFKHLKKQKIRNHSDISNHMYLKENQPSQVENIEYQEFKDAVQNVISQLPEKRRQIFLMHREDNLTYKEIAEVLEISIYTVETQMSRSLKFLNEKLARYK